MKEKSVACYTVALCKLLSVSAHDALLYLLICLVSVENVAEADSSHSSLIVSLTIVLTMSLFHKIHSIKVKPTFK